MKWTVLVCMIALIGCSHVAPQPVKTFRSSSASYAIGEEAVKYTGEPMVAEEELVYYKAPVASGDYQPPAQLGSTYPMITQGTEFTPYGRLDTGETLYRAAGLKPRTITGESVSWEYCIAADLEGQAYGDAACALGIVRRWEPKPENFLEMKVFHKEGTRRRELVYGGRSGDTIKVLYREFRGQLAAEAYFQELSYDLSESNTIRFRGMVIEVKEATNSLIRFTVRSRMDGKGGQEPSQPVRPLEGGA